jgi:hypothetical protein
MSVPKMEATARMINRGMVKRMDEKESQREDRNPFSFSLDNSIPQKKTGVELMPNASEMIPLLNSTIISCGT